MISLKSIFCGLVIAAGFLAANAGAQRLELGGMVGGGAFGLSSSGTAGSVAAGVEACLFCPGRLAVFAEYTHWNSVEHQGAFSDRVKNADLAGAGLRIQWFERARMFFDVGFVGGRDAHASGRGGGIGGLVVGLGVRVPLGGHWYIRPQVRVYGLSPHTLEGLDAHWATSFGAGLGYGF